MIICKGVCNTQASSKKAIAPYDTARYCKRCEWWQPKRVSSKCVCCNGILRSKPRHNRRSNWRELHVKRA